MKKVPEIVDTESESSGDESSDSSTITKKVAITITKPGTGRAKRWSKVER